MILIFRILLKIKYLFGKYTIRFKRKYFTYIVTLSAKSVGTGLKVNGLSHVSKNTILGNYVNFNGMSISGKGKVYIGNYFHSGPGCIIITGYHNYDKGDAIPYDSTYIHKDVVIEDNVWLGTNVTVLGGVTIGEGAIIQIGSVVVSSIPPLGIAGGHPAKVYKYRDKEHYYKLKEEGKFN
jgi:acetyltransferase-like isoleucine patch superfamily enzyme